jgi:hypothetical protein
MGEGTITESNVINADKLNSAPGHLGLTTRLIHRYKRTRMTQDYPIDKIPN